MRSLERVLGSKVASLTLIRSSLRRVCVNSISLVLNALPSASERKLKLLRFYANCRGLIKLGLNVWLLCLCFKAAGRWLWKWARQRRVLHRSGLYLR
ncbi:Thioredoxin [Candidatus Hodgkinia cicadicola]|nr:Thioredoxin [Candidatus Hodgkinia cicadicola]